jgi:hypothetical protein
MCVRSKELFSRDVRETAARQTLLARAVYYGLTNIVPDVQKIFFSRSSNDDRRNHVDKAL